MFSLKSKYLLFLLLAISFFSCDLLMSASQQANQDVDAEFVLISPDSLNEWIADSTYTIKWKYTSNTKSTVKLELYTENYSYSSTSPLLVIDANATNDGEYMWHINKESLDSLLTGKTYHGKVNPNEFHIKIIGKDKEDDDNVIAISSVFSIRLYDEFDNDSTIDMATSITDSQQTHIICKDDTDWVSIEVKGEEAKTLLCSTSNTRSINYKIYSKKPNIELISSGIIDESGKKINLPENSNTVVYYIKFSCSGSKYETYSLEPLNSLKIIYPNSSSTWMKDSTYEIKWIGSEKLFTYVNIALYKNGQQKSIISYSEKNDGSYSWEIPSSLSADSLYQIKILDYNDSKIYTISNYFSIVDSL